MIDLKRFAKIFPGYRIVEGIIINDSRFAFALTERDRLDGNAKYVERKTDMDSENGWRYLELGDLDAPTMGISAIEDGLIFCSGYWHIFTYLAEEAFHFENEFPSERENIRGGLSRMRQIGDDLYICGSNRTVGIRRGVDNWEWLSPTIPLTEEERKGLDTGFEEIDGFSENDIYVVGGRGDVWHFDGSSWERIELPARTEREWENLTFAVRCADNGIVYIAEQDRILYGKYGSSWQIIPFPKHYVNGKPHSMVWYEEKIWFTIHWGELYLVENGEVIKVADKPDLAPSIVHDAVWLDVKDGILLISGASGAAYKKDGEWTILLDYHDTLKQADRLGLVKGKPLNIQGGYSKKKKKSKNDRGIVLLEPKGPKYSYCDEEKEYFNRDYKSMPKDLRNLFRAISNNERSFKDLADWVLNDPELPKLKSLIFCNCWSETDEIQDFLDQLLLNKDRLQHIESLFIGRENETEYVDQCDYSQLWSALPNLKALVLNSSRTLELGTIDHKNLQYLEIISADLPDGLIPALKTAKLPKLETLLLYTWWQTPETVKGLLHKRYFPSLKTLGIMNSTNQGEMVKVVFESDLMPQLQRLYFCYGTNLEDDTGEYILENKHLLDNIHELYLTFNNFSNDMIKELKKLDIPLVELSVPQEDYVWVYAAFYHEVFDGLRDREIKWLKSNPYSIFGLWR